MINIIFAVILFLVLLVAFFIYKTSKQKKNGILLFGLSESGKTLIFARLLYKKFVMTHTSLKENIDDYIIGNSCFKIIDIPGHERLRGRYFDQYKTLARGLVFVIDSLNIQRDIKDVAEYLYICLTDNFVFNNALPMLILCNKQNEATAKGSTIIKMLLEKEMNILRTTKSNQLQSLGKTTNNIFLGKAKKDFEFSQLYPMKIDFAECSGIIDQNEKLYNVEELEKWIQGLV